MTGEDKEMKLLGGHVSMLLDVVRCRMLSQVLWGSNQRCEDEFGEWDRRHCNRN